MTSGDTDDPQEGDGVVSVQTVDEEDKNSSSDKRAGGYMGERRGRHCTTGTSGMAQTTNRVYMR